MCINVGCLYVLFDSLFGMWGSWRQVSLTFQAMTRHTFRREYEHNWSLQAAGACRTDWSILSTRESCLWGTLQSSRTWSLAHVIWMPSPCCCCAILLLTACDCRVVAQFCVPAVRSLQKQFQLPSSKNWHCEPPVSADRLRLSTDHFCTLCRQVCLTKSAIYISSQQLPMTLLSFLSSTIH